MHWKYPKQSGVYPASYPMGTVGGG